jgi:hypothetical protein
MRAYKSFNEWWRSERQRIRLKLKQKAKKQPLTEVESMIMNPFTPEQARTQVKNLNGIKDTVRRSR